MAPKKTESIKRVVRKVVERVVEKKGPEVKREELIKILREKLLTNDQLKRGNSATRGRHIQEQDAYQPVVDEVNEIGIALGLPTVTIGSLRR